MRLGPLGNILSHPNFVFLDPGGRRWNWIRLGVVLSLLLLFSLLIIFIRALFVKPELQMPDSLRAMKTELRTLNNPPPAWLILTSPG
jgi:hypothetical protein